MAKGFTLVELLIVICILAVLSAAVVVVLNPAALLAQSRDTTRISDLNSIHSALALYSVSTTTVDMGDEADSSSLLDGVNGDCNDALTAAGETNRDVAGTGWIEVPLSHLSGGSPIPAYPIDPTNNADYHYCYNNEDDDDSWEISANLESAKYMTTEDLDGTDGGDQVNAYEVGTNLTRL